MFATTFKKKIFIISALIIQFSLVNCGKVAEEKYASEINMKLEENPDQLARDVIVEFYDSTHLRAKLWAKTGKVFLQRGETWLYDSIVVQFFSKTRQERQSTLTADSAKINDRTKDMFAYGRVVVVADSPKVVLRTSFLEWRNKMQRLYSNEYVEITSSEEEVRGYGFESDLNLTNYKIYKVSGVKK